MKSISTLRKQGGVVLLEGLIAMTIFAFGVLAIVGMQASTSRAATDAKYRVDASFLVNQSLGQIWSDRANAASYAVTDQTVASLPKGKRTIAVVQNGNDTQVTVTVTWQMPGESTTHRHSSSTRING